MLRRIEHKINCFVFPESVRNWKEVVPKQILEIINVLNSKPKPVPSIGHHLFQSFRDNSLSEYCPLLLAEAIQKTLSRFNKFLAAFPKCQIFHFQRRQTDRGQ